MRKENPEILKTAFENVIKRQLKEAFNKKNTEDILNKLIKELTHKVNDELNKKKCNHTYPNGKSAIMPGCCMSFCMLCDWDNY